MEIEVWSGCSTCDNSCSDSENGDSSPPPPIDAGTTDGTLRALVSWLVTFFLLLQARFHVRNFVLGVFFVTLGHVYSACANIGHLFPATLYRARKSCRIDCNAFKK